MRNGGSYYVIIILSLFFSISKYHKINNYLGKTNKVIYDFEVSKNP